MMKRNMLDNYGVWTLNKTSIKTNIVAIRMGWSCQQFSDFDRPRKKRN